MIGGKLKTEKEYRAVQMESYSSLALFAKDRRKYFKKFILGESEEDEDNKAILIGNLAEALLPGREEEFEKKFYMSLCPEAPTGNMLAFVNALYKHTESNTEDGVVTVTFEELCKKAYVDSGYKLALDTVVKKFVGSEAEMYYTQLRETKPKGLTVVCQEDRENADRVVEAWKNSPFTAWYVNLQTDERYEIFDQFPVEGFEIDGVLFKCLVDRLIVDHVEKVIYIIDWKVTWAVEDFVREYYRKRFAYIQAFIYHTGLNMMKGQLGWEDYTILYPKFIVADSINYMDPLIYETNVVDLENAYNGFKIGGMTYPGVSELIEDLQWAKQNSFRISRRNFLNQGICQISEGGR